MRPLINLANLSTRSEGFNLMFFLATWKTQCRLISWYQGAIVIFTRAKQDERTIMRAVSWLVSRCLYLDRKRRKERERPGERKEERESFSSLLLTITFRAPIDLTRRLEWPEIVVTNSPWIAHFTVTGENETGVDLVSIQPFLLYYVNQVFLMRTAYF